MRSSKSTKPKKKGSQLLSKERLGPLKNCNVESLNLKKFKNINYSAKY